MIKFASHCEFSRGKSALLMTCAILLSFEAQATNATDTRIVQCKDGDGNVVADSYCSSAGAKPDTTRVGQTCAPSQLECPTGSTYSTEPAGWSSMPSWFADGKKISGSGNGTFGPSGGGMVENKYYDLPQGVPVAPSCPSGGTVNIIRNYRITGCRPYSPSPNGYGYTDQLIWSCQGYSGVCTAQAQFGDVYCT